MSEKNRRILIVDDNHAIHEDLRTILTGQGSLDKDSETKALEDELFNDESATGSPESDIEIHYKIDDAYQGLEAIEMVDNAEKEGDPYSLIFMDVRMPPGIDGIQTIYQIWQNHPHIEVVICTAYSDYSWNNIIKKLGITDRLFFLKKPFESVTINQIALSLTNKWNFDRKNDEHIYNLEKEVEKRTFQLENMISRLRAIKEDTGTKIISKSRCLSEITSVITAPLSGIMGMTDLLLDTDLDDEQRDFAEVIKLSGSSLYTVVHEALDVSEIENSTIQFSEIEFNLRTTVENITDHFSILAHEEGLTLIPLVHSDVPETLVGDPARLRQILANILTNAVKYTKTGEVVITISTESKSMNKKDAAQLCFRISDTSSGLPPESLEDFFGQVSTPDSSVRSGDDLTVSKKLVDLMGGNIGIESKEGKGTTIWFTLEFDVVATPDYRIESSTNTITGMRILAASDNLTNSKVIELYINHWGGKCRVAQTKESAVEKLHTALMVRPFDMVIIDLKSSKIETYIEYAAAIRQHKPVKNIPMICLTSQAKRGDSRILKENGFSAFLTKPIRQTHLFNCLLLLKDKYKDSSVLKHVDIITKHFVDEFASDKYYILVVGDLSENQRVLVSQLNKLKIRCDVAVDFRMALESYRINNYDMILMDCHSDANQGCDTVRKIRKQAHGKSNHIPILALMAGMKSEDKQRCLEAGMKDFLSTPYRIERTEEILKKYLLGKV